MSPDHDNKPRKRCDMYIIKREILNSQNLQIS